MYVAAVVESEMHSLDFEGTIMLVSPVTRGNSEEVRSVIDTNKVVKRKLENVTLGYFQFTFRFASVSCDNNRRQRFGFVIFAKRYLIGRTMICQVSRDPRLYSFKESINFPPIFLPSYSRLPYLFSFRTICLRE